MDEQAPARKYDESLAALFAENFREAARAAGYLAVSIRRTDELFPLDGARLGGLGEPALDAVHRHFGPNAGVWLFGSRANDSARGGDIDLYIETDIDDGVVARRIALEIELERLLGEQKIDLVVRPRSRALAAIHQIARREGIPLAPATSRSQ